MQRRAECFSAVRAAGVIWNGQQHALAPLQLEAMTPGGFVNGYYYGRDALEKCLFIIAATLALIVNRNV